MRILLILAGLSLSLAAWPQEIYRWVDKDGVVHYSDQPGAPGAVRVVVIDPNSYTEEESSDGTDAGSGGAPETREPQETSYGSLTIVQPQADQVFFGAEATVTAAAAGTEQSKWAAMCESGRASRCRMRTASRWRGGRRPMAS